jgi:uncharacterized protein YjdB
MKRPLLLTLFAMMISIASFALDPITGPGGECVGSSLTLMDSTSGGVWSSSDPSIASIDPATGVVTGVSVGSVTITYTLLLAYVTHPFVISNPPAAIAGTTLVCTGGSSTLTDPTPGGFWTTSSPYFSVSYGGGDVYGISAGVGTVSYSVFGCATTTTVTVNSLSAGVITGDTSVCTGSTITLSETVPGGVWSSVYPAIGSVDASTGVVTGLSGGTTTIYYTVTGGCGTVVAYHAVNVYATTPTGTIYGTLSTTIGGTSSLYDVISGGTWSSSNPAVATINATTGIVTGVSTGTTTITYSVSGGCSGPAYTTASFSVYSIISGNVNFSGTPHYGPVKVWLITYNPSTFNLQAIDSQTVYASGATAYYQFNGEPTDSFRIKAGIDSSYVGVGYIPTYHTSNFYWHDAAVLYHLNTADDIHQDIDMATGTITAGPGFIAGDVTTGANKGTAGGAPAKGLHVCVVNSTTHALVQQTYTDATGAYSFSNLPVGQTYYVFPDSLNFVTTAYTSITLTATNPSMSVAQFNMHTISHTITPKTASISNVTSATSSVFAFPNPTAGKLNIQWEVNTTESAQVSITDITGREVYNSTINMTQGIGAKQVDLTSLTNGLYMISVTSATVNYNSKIQVQH